MKSKKEEVLVPRMGWGSITDSNEEKTSLDYGLKVARSIQYEWFNKGTNGCRYYDRLNNFVERRMYARGEQPVNKYKERLKTNGDLSWLNMDWSPLKIMNKYVDIVTNGMSDREFHPRAYAHDAAIETMRSKFRESVEMDMYAKDFLSEAKQITGVDGFTIPEDEIPETDEELNVFMQMHFKPAVEIANEIAISNVMDMNDFDQIRDDYNMDSVVCGVGVIKHGYNDQEGITIDYVDPEFWIHSYTDDKYFRDCFYFGEVKDIPLTELRRINPDIDDDQLKEIEDTAQKWIAEYRNKDPYSSDSGAGTVKVLYFSYNTEYDYYYKKKLLPSGGVKAIDKGTSFNPPKDQLGTFYEVIKTTRDTWFEGVLILGTDKLLKWEPQKNLVFPESTYHKPLPPYIACAPRMYKGRIESHVSRCMTFVDMIQLNHYKLQQVAQKVVPDGVFIDVDGLNSIDLGNGSKYGPMEALNLYFQTGSVVGRSSTEDGEFNHGKVPIQPISSNSGIDKMNAIIMNMNYYLKQIDSVTGLGGLDTSIPDSNALVGLQKMAALNSNVATRHILRSSLFTTERLANALSARISDVIKYSPDREAFISMIGRSSVEVLDVLERLPLHSFGIQIEMSPDASEKEELEQNIKLAISKGNLEVEDAIDIRQTRNIKLANEILKIKKKKRAEAKRTFELMRDKMNAENNLKAQQAAAQNKAQLTQMEAQAKMAVNRDLIKAETEKLMAEAELKLKLMNHEFQLNTQVESKRLEQERARLDQAEDRKDKRAKMQATQNSKMIEQRHKDTPPIDFESNEDSLDGFGLEEFNPR